MGRTWKVALIASFLAVGIVFIQSGTATERDASTSVADQRALDSRMLKISRFRYAKPAVTLSDGTLLSPRTTVGTLTESISRVLANRLDKDLELLVGVLEGLNGVDVGGRCSS